MIFPVTKLREEISYNEKVLSLSQCKSLDKFWFDYAQEVIEINTSLHFIYFLKSWRSGRDWNLIDRNDVLIGTLINDDFNRNFSQNTVLLIISKYDYRCVNARTPHHGNSSLDSFGSRYPRDDPRPGCRLFPIRCWPEVGADSNDHLYLWNLAYRWITWPFGDIRPWPISPCSEWYQFLYK